MKFIDWLDSLVAKFHNCENNMKIYSETFHNDSYKSGKPCVFSENGKCYEIAIATKCMGGSWRETIPSRIARFIKRKVGNDR